LTALLFCLHLIPVSALEGGRVEIASVQDLMELAENCRLDSWSEGKTVVLTADIDLSGTDFSPIPSFQGRFEGGGHTISGLSLTGKGSRVGLFRVIEEGGFVEDLTVEGAAAPTGSASSVGLLCGENAGGIYRCTARGSVTGQKDVGGLVGLNTGTLSGCDNRAAVTGIENTGGLVGRNTGAIHTGDNWGEVNTAASSAGLTEAVMNTGGVAGYSEGELELCRNHADVGYPHEGYNVGGVAGVHSGTMTDCSNFGQIHGRKGAGGVVGRFVPQTDMVYGKDPVKALDSALAGLFDLMGQLSTQLSGTVGDGLEHMETISEDLGVIRDAAEAGVKQGSEDAGAAVEAIRSDLKDINDAADALRERFRTFSETFGEEFDQFLKHLSSFRAEINNMMDAVSEGMDAVITRIDSCGSALERDMKAIRTALEQMGADMEKLEDFLGQAIGILAGEGENAEKLEALRGAAKSLDGLEIGAQIKAIGAALENMGSSISTLTSALESIYRDADSDVGLAWRQADRAAAGMTADLRKMNEELQSFSQDSADQLAIVNDRVDSIETTLYDWGQKLGQVGDRTMEKIGDRLDSVETAVNALTQGGKTANQELSATADAIIAQLDQVRLAAGGLTSTPEHTVDDRSEEGEEDGVIARSRNEGAVTADGNVGGVAGIISFQLSDDPEEELDWDKGGSVLSSVTAVVRAAVRECENLGPVTAKNECAGGIVGRSDMGAVLRSANRGDVTVENGENCGGIVGLSRSLVQECWALCRLTGSDKVGGIAGTAADLEDCRAMAELDAGGEKLGGVAGWAEGTLTENYCVAEGLGAVDGIDLSGKAQGLPYEEFRALEDLPDSFSDFSLTFMAQEETVARVAFEYGGSLADGDIPAVPQREGYYGVWEKFDARDLRRSRTIEAVYTPWASTVSSGGTWPVLLAEGAFSPEASLTVSDFIPGDAGISGSVAAAWLYELADPAGDLPETVGLRVLARDGGEKAKAVFWNADGVAREVKEAVREGSYLVFEAPTSGAVAIVTPPKSKLPYIAAGGGAVLAAGVLLALRKRRNKTAAGVK